MVFIPFEIKNTKQIIVVISKLTIKLRMQMYHEKNIYFNNIKFTIEIKRGSVEFNIFYELNKIGYGT